MNLAVLLAYVSWFSVLIPLSFSLLKLRLEREMYWLRILLIVSFLCDLLGYFLAMSGHRNLWLANFFFLFQFCTILLIFSIVSTKQSRYYFYFLGTIVPMFFLLNFVSGDSKTYLDTYSTALSSLAIMFMSIRFFIQILRSLPTQEIHKYPVIWIVIAVFFYYSGTLLVFVSYNYFVELGPSLNMSFWSFSHNFLNITKNLLFAVALWRNLRKVS